MQPLLMPLLRIAPPTQTPLMASHRVLVRLQAPILAPPMTSDWQEIIQQRIILPPKRAILPLPPKREIARTNHFDKIHIIECGIVRELFRLIERVQMMVRPRHRILCSKPLCHAFRHLGTKAQMMDLMRECMRIPIRCVQVVVQIMHMHRSIAETPSWRNVEISNDLVDAEPAFDSATLPTLGI